MSEVLVQAGDLRIVRGEYTITLERRAIDAMDQERWDHLHTVAELGAELPNVYAGSLTDNGWWLHEPGHELDTRAISRLGPVDQSRAFMARMVQLLADDAGRRTQE